MPDFLQYHRSITAELHSLKDRVRDLVDYAKVDEEDQNRSHWLTDGEHKESALRAIIRRHIGSSMVVGRGFIVTEHTSSTQVDILIVDGNTPTVFRDGELLIVTPDAVIAAIEVKTSLKPFAEIKQCVAKLCAVEELCGPRGGRKKLWTGLFVYDLIKDNAGDDYDMLRQHGRLLKNVKLGCEGSSGRLNCLSIGKDNFVRWWTDLGLEYAQIDNVPDGASWRSYSLDRIAPTYFISNLLDAVSSVDRDTSAFAWFPHPGGKYGSRTWVMPEEAGEPISQADWIAYKAERESRRGLLPKI